MMRTRLVGLAVAALALAACGGNAGQENSPATDTAEGGMGMGGMEMGGDTSAFGEAADVGDADRTIAISMFDAYRYEPDEITVTMGETIAFEVTNEGTAVHEFVLGDEAFHEAHEAEMQAMEGEMPSDEPYAISVEPGQTESIAWTFSNPGTFTYACHVSGHYGKGMVGTITVTE